MSHACCDHLVERLDLVADECVDPVELPLELGIGLEVPRHHAAPSRVHRRELTPVPIGAARRRRRGPRTTPASAGPAVSSGGPGASRPAGPRRRRAAPARPCRARGRRVDLVLHHRPRVQRAGPGHGRPPALPAPAGVAVGARQVEHGVAAVAAADHQLAAPGRLEEPAGVDVVVDGEQAREIRIRPPAGAGRCPAGAASR